MKKVVIGFLGSSLDRRGKNHRWDKWRPSVAICQHEDLLIDKFHLLYNARNEGLALQVKSDIKLISPETNVILEKIELKNPWDFEEVFSELLEYTNNYSFKTKTEEYLLHITTGTHVAQICLFLLTEAGFFPGKLIQTGPGRQNTPPGNYEIIDLDLSRYDSIAKRFSQQINDDISFLKSGIKTKSKKFNALISEVEKVTLRSSDPILLTGPTGAGKSRLAKQIFELKKQKNIVCGEFVEVNCATLRGDMALSVLFGHTKGAFTGAEKARTGLLKKADNGVIFLDEIGELGLDEQAMLLQAIENKCFFSVGSDTETKSDFQLICGTNKSLHKCVHEGVFREDLLARINFWSFKMPGLAERKEDIEPNVEFELQKRSKTIGKPVNFSKEAKTAYLNFAMKPEAIWKANFRDLNNSINRMSVLCEGNRISSHDVEKEIKRLKSEWHSVFEPTDKGLIQKLISSEKLESIDLFDRLQLEQVLQVCAKAKNLPEAGRILFSESRKSRQKINDSDRLRKYLQKFNLDWETISTLTSAEKNF